MNERERVAIVGCGSMGTLLGARLTSQGRAVQMVDASREIVAAVNQNGLTATGQVDIHVPAEACLPGDLTGTFDLLILLTKQTHNPAVFPVLARHMGPDSVVVTLQNGIPETAAAEFFGTDRVMGCAVNWSASLVRPGVTCSATRFEDWHNSLGTLDGRKTGKVEDVGALLSLMCPTEITDHLMGIRWSKLLVNSALSGVSTALGCPFGRILEDSAALRCTQYVALECVQTARAAGIHMEPLIPGEDFETLIPFQTEEEREATTWLYRKMLGASAEGKASMLQDLLRGNRTEIDYINGAVCRTAEKVGVDVPYCRAVVDIVKAVEAGRRTAGFENLALFPA